MNIHQLDLQLILHKFNDRNTNLIRSKVSNPNNDLTVKDDHMNKLDDHV